MTDRKLSAAATALLARLHLPVPASGEKLSRDAVDRAVQAVPLQRRVFAVADLKFHGLMSH